MRISEQDGSYVLEGYDRAMLRCLVWYGGRKTGNDTITISKQDYLTCYSAMVDARSPAVATDDGTNASKSANRSSKASQTMQETSSVSTQTPQAFSQPIPDTKDFLQPIITPQHEPVAVGSLSDEQQDVDVAHFDPVECHTERPSKPLRPLTSADAMTVVSLPSNFSGFTNFENLQYEWMS